MALAIAQSLTNQIRRSKQVMINTIWTHLDTAVDGGGDEAEEQRHRERYDSRRHSYSSGLLAGKLHKHTAQRNEEDYTGYDKHYPAEQHQEDDDRSGDQDHLSRRTRPGPL